MTLSDLLGPEPKIVDLRSETRWGAIEELIHHLVVTGRIAAEHRDEIAEAVRKREASAGTGIGFGVGVPNAATDRVPDPVCALGRSRNGVQFDALDGKPVHAVILFLVPPGQFEKHLHTLATIAGLLHKEDFRRRFWDGFM